MKKIVLIIACIFTLSVIFSEEPSMEDIERATELFESAGQEFEEAQGLYVSANEVMDRVETDDSIELDEIEEASADFESASEIFATAESDYAEANAIFAMLDDEEGGEEIEAEPVYVEEEYESADTEENTYESTAYDGEAFIIYSPRYDLDADYLSDEEKMNIEASIYSLGDPAASKYTIRGYTDAIYSAYYNKILSIKRAMSVLTYLVDLGVPEENISIKGMGETEPLGDNETEDGRAENRRADIYVE